MFLVALLTSALAAHAADSHTEGVSPEVALSRLVDGNRRYIADKPIHPGQRAADRARAAKGQTPHTMVLTCADSRVGPELLFDQGLGDLFVVRAAGNNVDDHLVASLEYAEEHLGSRLLVVMGHTSCGAVKAAATTPAGTTAGSPSLDELVADIQTCMGPLTAAQLKDPTLREAVHANAVGAGKALLGASPILRHAVETGHLRVVPAVYDLASGFVTFDAPLAMPPQGASQSATPEAPAHAAPAPAPPASDAHGGPAHR
jgi:carbonic anhydrase